MTFLRVGRFYVNAAHLSAVRMTPDGRAEVGFRDTHTVVLEGGDAAVLRRYLDRHPTDPPPPTARPPRLPATSSCSSTGPATATGPTRGCS
jgi:hypothetical protein